MKTSGDLKKIEISRSLLLEVPARLALRYAILPLMGGNGSLKLAIPEELSNSIKEELRIVLGRNLEFVSFPRPEIESAIQRLYGVGAGTIEALAEEKEDEGEFSAEGGSTAPFGGEVIDSDKKEEATIIQFVNELLLDALTKRASDIHIEPFEKTFRIRYRVDGILREARVSERIRLLAPSLISRIKIMASLDIGEKRLPQDGRIKISAKGARLPPPEADPPGRVAEAVGQGSASGGKKDREELDLRVSVLPSSSGEAIVIRILKPLELLNLEELGFDEEAVIKIKSIIQKPHGMILVTGPTGSGKTTTLYACLKELNTLERKIITIEDPIEYKLPGIIQIQANPKIGLTFTKALRSMLRHDPDVLMVGEIRDTETAEIAIRSALTGHLVLSTLHTNDAPSAVTRLLEMGIEPYLVASSLNSVLAQRLVRKLCPSPACRQAGCDKCSHTGFFGRTVLSEFMEISEATRSLIGKRVSASTLREQAIKEGMATLLQDGMRKVEERLTSKEEVQRVMSL